MTPGPDSPSMPIARSRRRSGRRQRGMATILVMLLVGLSLSATVLGLMHHIRGTQDQSLSLHAQTQAQIKAWTGVSIVKGYLKQLQESGHLADLATAMDAAAAKGSPGVTLTMTGIDGITARVTSTSTPMPAGGDPTLYAVEITGVTAVGTRAEASSTLQVVFKVGSTTAGTNTNVVSFNKNLQLGGSIQVQGEAGKSYQINVRGDLSTGGNSITGVSIIKSTGSIDIGSGSSFDTLQANGDIRLTGSVSGQQNLQARGNICLSGAAAAKGTVRANGSVVGNGSAAFGDVSTIGISDNTGTVLCGARQLEWGVDLQGNSSAANVATKGSVQINSGSISGTLLAEKNLVDTNWGGTEHGAVGGTVTGADPATTTWVTVTPGLQVPVASVSEIAISTANFNANEIESAANYVFKIDGNGYKVITVRNVSGIASGDYFLGDYDGGYKDYLCTSLAPGSTSGSPKCLLPAVSTAVTICKGYSDNNNCFGYGNGTWTLNGTSIAQGIAWFKGNLTVGNGTYFNTFIATGNIASSGSTVIYAPNYAGYSGAVNGVTYAPTGICANSYFPKLFPTQFCNSTAKTYDYSASNGLGNYALMAGSTNGTTYSGGGIALGSSNAIYGSIKAGNEFGSGGSTTVYGYITALAQGTSTSNAMGASTTIKLTNLPAGYDPGANGAGGGSSGSTNGVIALWSRYL
ncbi:hypothetical protein BH10PSE18_BH10PSE18_13580 [soil metagenome]